MDWNEMERKRVSLLNGFLTLFYLPIDLALLYRLSPPLYSVDAQIGVNRYIEVYPKEYVLRILYWTFIKGYPKENLIRIL